MCVLCFQEEAKKRVPLSLALDYFIHAILRRLAIRTKTQKCDIIHHQKRKNKKDLM
jgi:hypothetical protein